jgi:F0F1-type ATP synthase assembly protein I
LTGIVQCRRQRELPSRPFRTEATGIMTVKEGKPWSAEFAPYLTLGLQLAISVVVFFFVGRWLDGQFGTSPWLMIGGLLIGTAGGFIQFFRTVAALGRKQETGKGPGPGKSERSGED